jgi:hypothetical protein
VKKWEDGVGNVVLKNRRASTYLDESSDIKESSQMNKYVLIDDVLFNKRMEMSGVQFDLCHASCLHEGVIERFFLEFYRRRSEVRFFGCAVTPLLLYLLRVPCAPFSRSHLAITNGITHRHLVEKFGAHHVTWYIDWIYMLICPNGQLYCLKKLVLDIAS